MRGYTLRGDRRLSRALRRATALSFFSAAFFGFHFLERRYMDYRQAVDFFDFALFSAAQKLYQSTILRHVPCARRRGYFAEGWPPALYHQRHVLMRVYRFSPHVTFITQKAGQ